MRVVQKKISKQGCAAPRKVPHEVPAKVFKAKKKLSKQGCVTVVRSSATPKQNKKNSSPQEKGKDKKEEELQRSFANCLRRSAVKIPNF